MRVRQTVDAEDNSIRQIEITSVEKRSEELRRVRILQTRAVQCEQSRERTQRNLEE